MRNGTREQRVSRLRARDEKSKTWRTPERGIRALRRKPLEALRGKKIDTGSGVFGWAAGANLFRAPVAGEFLPRCFGVLWGDRLDLWARSSEGCGSFCGYCANRATMLIIGVMMLRCLYSGPDPSQHRQQGDEHGEKRLSLGRHVRRVA
jgi:hypothetical protein